MRKWLFLALCGTWLHLQAQEGPISSRRLERWRELGQYERIRAAYVRSPHLFPMRYLPFVAEAYFYSGEPQEAFSLYRQAASTGTEGWAPEHFWQYASLLHQQGDFQRARLYYKRYAEQNPSDPAGVLRLAQLEVCAQLQASAEWKLEIVPELSSYKPVYAAWWTGTQLYAVSRSAALGAPLDREGRPYERIVPQAPVRYRYHQAVIGNIGDTLLLYLSKGRGNVYAFVPTAAGRSQPRSWRAIPRLPAGRVSLAFDPKTGDVYFTRDAGVQVAHGRDLYRCRYLGNGKYSPPERLPAPINTPYNEDAPFIVEDTLYFASNGPASAGGYDIFYAVRVGERDWGPPQPMPAPINSCANDIYFYRFSEKHTYLSSDREGSFQVYRVQYVPPVPPSPPVSEPPPPAVAEPPPPPPVPRFAV